MSASSCWSRRQVELIQILVNFKPSSTQKQKLFFHTTDKTPRHKLDTRVCAVQRGEICTDLFIWETKQQNTQTAQNACPNTGEPAPQVTSPLTSDPGITLDACASGKTVLRVGFVWRHPATPTRCVWSAAWCQTARVARPARSRSNWRIYTSCWSVDFFFFCRFLCFYHKEIHYFSLNT